MIPEKTYFDHLAAIPLPSFEQTDQFARAIRKAHSWYKKLPIEKPGVVFTFLLDPFRGTKFSRRSKEEDESLLHRFGHWCFIADQDADSVIELNGLAIPKDIIQTCSKRFTACLFDDGDRNPRSWRDVLKRRMGSGLDDEELDLLLAEACSSRACCSIDIASDRDKLASHHRV